MPPTDIPCSPISIQVQKMNVPPATHLCLKTNTDTSTSGWASATSRSCAIAVSPVRALASAAAGASYRRQSRARSSASPRWHALSSSRSRSSRRSRSRSRCRLWTYRKPQAGCVQQVITDGRTDGRAKRNRVISVFGAVLCGPGTHPLLHLSRESSNVGRHLLKVELCTIHGDVAILAPSFPTKATATHVFQSWTTAFSCEFCLRSRTVVWSVYDHAPQQWRRMGERSLISGPLRCELSAARRYVHRA